MATGVVGSESIDRNEYHVGRCPPGNYSPPLDADSTKDPAASEEAREPGMCPGPRSLHTQGRLPYPHRPGKHIDSLPTPLMQVQAEAGLAGNRKMKGEANAMPTHKRQEVAHVGRPLPFPIGFTTVRLIFEQFQLVGGDVHQQ